MEKKIDFTYNLPSSFLKIGQSGDSSFDKRLFNDSNFIKLSQEKLQNFKSLSPDDKSYVKDKVPLMNTFFDNGRKIQVIDSSKNFILPQKHVSLCKVIINYINKENLTKNEIRDSIKRELTSSKVSLVFYGLFIAKMGNDDFLMGVVTNTLNGPEGELHFMGDDNQKNQCHVEKHVVLEILRFLLHNNINSGIIDHTIYACSDGNGKVECDSCATLFASFKQFLNVQGIEINDLNLTEGSIKKIKEGGGEKTKSYSIEDFDVLKKKIESYIREIENDTMGTDYTKFLNSKKNVKNDITLLRDIKNKMKLNPSQSANMGREITSLSNVEVKFYGGLSKIIDLREKLHINIKHKYEVNEDDNRATIKVCIEDYLRDFPEILFKLNEIKMFDENCIKSKINAIVVVSKSLKLINDNDDYNTIINIYSSENKKNTWSDDVKNKIVSKEDKVLLALHYLTTTPNLDVPHAYAQMLGFAKDPKEANNGEVTYNDNHYYVKGSPEDMIPGDGNCLFHAILFSRKQNSMK